MNKISRSLSVATLCVLLAGCITVRTPEPRPPAEPIACAPEVVAQCMDIDLAEPEGQIPHAVTKQYLMAVGAAFRACKEKHCRLLKCTKQGEGECK